MKRLLLPFTMLILLALACSLPSLSSSISEPSTNPSPLAPTQKSPCGDGVCQGPENAQNCPEDCTEGQEALVSPDLDSATPVEHTYQVTNPTSGVQLLVRVFTPAGVNEEPLPALVLVPGGNGSSVDFTKPGRATTVPTLTSAGFAVVLFDPDSRGQSQGTEDYNGFTQQDGLAAVIEFASGLPEVDSVQMGLVSYSYGITMASGALARHPDLPIRFLIDWEGPANRDDTGGCDGAGLGHLEEVASCDNNNFWKEREASTFVLSLLVPYLRLQSEKDHVQPDYDHALLLINNATSTAYGGKGQSPWTRLNNLPPNQIYSFDAPPEMTPENKDKNREALVARYAQELLSLP